MDLQLNGRTAVVMASTSGLGAAIATGLANEGANVVVTGPDQDKAERLAKTLPAAIGAHLDIANPDGLQSVVDAARRAFGEPDIIVLNGPGPRASAAGDLDADGARSAFDTLVLPHISLVRLVLPAMRCGGWGRILAVGSSGVVAPIPMLTASNMGRAALAAYLKSLASEVARDGITVNMLLPGRIATARTTALDAATAVRSGASVEQVRAQSHSRIPTGRYGDSAEFAATAVFLCSVKASYITGSLVRCDGGLLANL